MTMREHMHDLHKRLAEHHVKKAAFHKIRAERMRDMLPTEKIAGEVETLTALSNMHEEMSQEHTDMAAFHLECCKSLKESRKAAGMGGDFDLEQIVPLPEGLSTIAPTHVRAVSRFGQREIPRDMDPAVAKIVGVGSDE